MLLIADTKGDSESLSMLLSAAAPALFNVYVISANFCCCNSTYVDMMTIDKSTILYYMHSCTAHLAKHNTCVKSIEYVVL